MRQVMATGDDKKQVASRWLESFGAPASGLTAWITGRPVIEVELLEVYANYAHLLGKFRQLRELPRRKPDPPRRPPKQVHHRLTADQQAEVLERYLAGEKAHRLAKDFQVHRTTIAKLVADAGVHRPRSLTPDQVQQATTLYAQGWSCDRIGQHLGKEAGTIWRALKQAGVKLRDTHGRER
jgi:hypothetical protein